ncbi:carboxymuconolactone decarboxylase family protein [Acetobacter sp. AN02]|uniref:carboxymuconolactone decarboxylase family protein n=1 Tax=Acetobacter sp. AN02 TaxID=2894186 RepID=UPI0024343BAD|nr:carboxymuconolactone decarboxylase family protein [Acetobacter sp. AN02]MDG6094043.1 carboxymuconolactone decarboxylase family protein [Acetobacter sp. AN02]
MSDWSDWNERRTHLIEAIGEFGKTAPETLKGFAALDSAAEKGGNLDAKTRELIAIAVAVTTRCDGCISVHAEAALKAGATKAEIAEALSVAVALNAGAAMVYSTRVMDAVNKATK